MAGHAYRYVVAAGIFLGALIPALPDTAPFSPRALATAASLGLVGAGVYLGAPRPEA